MNVYVNVPDDKLPIFTQFIKKHNLSYQYENNNNFDADALSKEWELRFNGVSREDFIKSPGIAIKGGDWKGKINVDEDFNEPLEDFKEYM
ncbi:MAG: DUF2281 domain-containing protein [Oscillospiraceae bacterium]|jgi:hypothetical protein|nr:DUF2281 domain-containing protein [Oscillospiraceae bacterium]